MKYKKDQEVLIVDGAFTGEVGIILEILPGRYRVRVGDMDAIKEPHQLKAVGKKDEPKADAT